ncbi:MAG TPA: hypothetical protein PLX33_07290 [Alphaproteobacteria bacterium]|nr:hypothetical protein [Alphaproteobacteria bacterium]
MKKETQTMSRAEAIAALDMHYAPSLERLHAQDLLAPRPQTLEGQLLRLARFDASSVIGITEELGAARESYQFSNIDTAQEQLAADRRAHYAQHRSTITTLLMDEKTQEALAQEKTLGEDTPKPVTAAAAKAAATVQSIDAALAETFTFNLRPLKDTLTLPAQILNVGQSVYVLRNTDTLPTMSEERVAAREVTPAFFGGLSAQFNYTLTQNGKAPTSAQKDKDAEHVIAATRDDAPQGLSAAGKNILVFNSKAAAREALRDIVSEKLDAADAQRAALSQTLKAQGLTRRKLQR